MTRRIFLIVALGLIPAAAAWPQEPRDPQSPDEHLQVLIAECEACHGPGGVSSEPDVPSLAGQSLTYLRELLEQFYNYERHCPTTTYRHGDRPRTPLNMCNIANALSEQDKHALAVYFSEQAMTGEAGSAPEG